MSVAGIDGWRLPGCGEDCRPRGHDPYAHEAYGRQSVPAPDTFESGPLLIDFRRLEVRLSGQVARLTPTELRLLAVLARHADAAVTIETIVRSVWGADYLRVRAPEYANLVRTAMGRLRSNLGLAGDLITTLPGLGYRLEVIPPEQWPSTRTHHGKRLPSGRWSRAYDACVCCGRSTLPHNSGGRCTRCYRTPQAVPHYGPCRRPGS